MIDGSKLVFKENVKISKEVVDIAKKYGAAVEGELGNVGAKEYDTEGSACYTDPSEAVKFAKETLVWGLAASAATISIDGAKFGRKDDFDQLLRLGLKFKKLN